MEKARALLIGGKEQLNYVELEKPEIGDYEVLFRTKAVGLCTIEKRAYTAAREFEYPFLGGHEVCGVVEKVGRRVADVEVGDHAIATFTYCMQCHNDRMGIQNQCQHKKATAQRSTFTGNTLGGGMCEYLVVPAWQLVKIDKSIPFEKACLIEPIACVVHSINKAKIQFGDTVLIIGFGVMGYLHLKMSLLKGARVIVCDTDDFKCERAKQEGAHRVINSSKENIREIINEMTNGNGVEVVFNTIPVAAAWNDIFEVIGSGSRVIAYSSQDKKVGVPVDFGVMHNKEYEFIGTISPNLEDNDRASRLVEYGIIDPSKFTDGVFDFEDGENAFKKACDSHSYRVVLKY